MSKFTTELMNVLQEKQSLDDFFRDQLETAMNALLQSEITAHLGYEKHDSNGWHSGNSRNGTYPRTLATPYGDLHLIIPRDRCGTFEQQTVPRSIQHTDRLEMTVIQLYQHGVTTREIGTLIEQMYGHHYSPAAISNMAKSMEEQVHAFQTRKIAPRYAVVYCDATYLNVRRDSVAKEALHVILGITPEGYKEVLAYALYPSEAAENYREMLEGLKERGLKEVLLFVSDGLAGLPHALRRAFPHARHQACWTHLSRQVARRVRISDRKDVLEDLKEVYRAEDAHAAQEQLEQFLAKHKKKYPQLGNCFLETDSLYSFYAFPKAIQQSLYTSNLIENNNKGLKHLTKKKEQFPNEDSLMRFLCCYYSDYNRKHGERIHKGFQEAAAELLEMFQS